MMAWFKPAISATQRVGSYSGGIVRRTYLTVIFFFLIVLISNAVLISYNEEDFSAGINYLGEKTFNPIQNIHDSSKAVVDNGGAIFRTGKFLKTSYTTFDTWFSIISGLIIIGLWIKIIAWVLLMMGMDLSRKPFTSLMGVLIFFMFQAIYLAINGQDISIIPDAFIYLLNAIIIAIPGLAKFGEYWIN